MAVLVGKKAPHFSAPAVVNGGEIKFKYLFLVLSIHFHVNQVYRLYN